MSPLRGDRKREYQLEWMRKRREAWMKENGPCVRCGSWDNLEAHHRDPETKEHHAVWSWSKTRMLLELAKCDVLCRICHAKHHAQERQLHGTRTRYQAGCRCNACVNYPNGRAHRYKRFGDPPKFWTVNGPSNGKP